MGKIKSLLMLLMGAVLAIFIYENWVTAPAIKIFNKELGQLQTSLIIIICFTLGFITGWLSLFSWNHRRRKKTELVSRQEDLPESPKEKDTTQQEEKKE